MEPQPYHTNPYEDHAHGEMVIVNLKYVRDLIYEYMTPLCVDAMLNRITETRGDLYSGTAGIAYMFLRLHQSCNFFGFHGYNEIYFAEKYIKAAKASVVDPPNHDDRRKQRCALLRGNAGIYCVSSLISSIKNSDEYHNDIAEYRSGFDVCKHIDFRPEGGDDMLVGRAGYVSGMLWLNKHITPKPFYGEQLTDICEIMIASGRRHSTDKGSRFPLLYKYQGIEYLGAAHGCGSSLLMMLRTHFFLGPDGQIDQYRCPQDYYAYIRRTIDILVGLQDNDGNFPCAAEDLGQPSQKDCNWCNGAPGMFYLILKSYFVYNDRTYLDCCHRIADLVWKYGLLKRGPGLCCGVAGNGYVFLMMYRATREPKYLYRATKFAEFLKHPEFLANTLPTDSPNGLFEGVAGTVCFLADLLYPHNETCFPFMDVF